MRLEVGWRLLDELFDQSKAAIFGIEGSLGLKSEFWAEPVPIGVNIGEIGDDKVVLTVNLRKEIRLIKIHFRTEIFSVFARDGEGLKRDIDRIYL